MDKRREFFDESAGTWNERLAGDGRAPKLPQVVEWFGVREGETILDVGTGTGILLPLLGHVIGSSGRLIAMDFSFNMLKKAMEGPCEARRALLNAAAGAIPLKSEEVDRVTCFSAFPHFPDKEKALEEMARVVKRGGMVFVAHLHSRAEIEKLHSRMGNVVGGDRLPEPEKMRHSMERAGLSDVEVVDEPGKFLAQGRKG